MNSLDMVVRETGSMFTVDARALHEWLGVRKDFSDWFKDQVERIDMVERIDYEVVFPLKGVNSRGRPAKDFMITISAAKHIGMMSNTGRGKEVRRYFEACEDKLRDLQQPMDELEMMAAMIKAQLDQRASVRALEASVDRLSDKIAAVEQHIKIDDEYVTISGFLSLTKSAARRPEVIKELGIQASKYCKEHGIPISQVPSVKWGKVNAYPKTVLAQLIQT